MKNVRRSQIVGLGLAAVGATGLVAAVRAPFAVKGVSYRVRVSTQNPNLGGGGRGAGGGGTTDVGAPPPGGGGGGGGGGFPGGFGNTQLVRVEVAGDRANVQFQVGQPPGTSINDYYVILLDSNKTYRVSPDVQTYSDANLATNGRGRGGGGGGGGGGGAGGNPGGGGNRGANNNGGNPNGRGGRGGGFNPGAIMADMVITDVKSNVEDLGAGEVIETRPTHHYKITVDYGFKLYGQPRVAKTTTEIWAIDYPQRVVNPFDAGVAAGDSGTIADVNRRLIDEAKKLPGVPVKIVTTQTLPLSAMGGDSVEVAANGSIPQTANIVRTTLITALKDADIDEADLKVPADYKKVAAPGRGGL